MEEQIQYLLSLEAVRDRSKIVFEAAKSGSLNHFIYDASRMDAAADYVTAIIKVGSERDRFGGQL